MIIMHFVLGVINPKLMVWGTIENYMLLLGEVRFELLSFNLLVDSLVEYYILVYAPEASYFWDL